MAGGEPRFGTLSTYMALMMPCSPGAVDIKTLIYMGMFERPNRPAFAQNQPLTGLDSQKFRLDVRLGHKYLETGKPSEDYPRAQFPTRAAIPYHNDRNLWPVV